MLTLLMIFAVSCTSEAVRYKNDVAISALCEKTEQIISDTEGLVAVPESYVTNIMKIDLALFTEYAVFKQATGETIDEYGIFKVAAPDNADTAVKAVTDYVTVTQNTSMVEDYMPEEAPKLAGAEVKVMGEYVIYCILSEDTKAAVFEAIESVLAEK